MDFASLAVPRRSVNLGPRPPAVSFLRYGSGPKAVLVFGGVITASPLIMFTAAARRLRYATVGLFQYLAPTMQFLVAVFLYDEAFTDAHKITFGMIWLALAIYSADTFMGRRRAV